MKSMNFIFAGAMIFLLLVVDSTVSDPGSLTHDAPCIFKEDIAPAGERCNGDKGLLCRKGTKGTAAGTDPDTPGDALKPGEVDGKCLCGKEATKLTWKDDTTGCDVGGGGGGKTDVMHGEDCNTLNTCKAGKFLKCMAAGDVNTDEIKPDDDEAVPSGTADGKCGCAKDGSKKRIWKGGECITYTTITTVKEHNGDCDADSLKVCDAAQLFMCMPNADVSEDGSKEDEASTIVKTGKCGCAKTLVGDKQTWKDGVCKVVSKVGPADHGQKCGGATNIPCKEAFKCHKGGEVDKEGDKKGNVVTGTEEGVCVCEEAKKTAKDGKCAEVEVEGGTTVNTNTGATDAAASGGDRIVYQPILLQLSVAAMGSLRMLGCV